MYCRLLLLFVLATLGVAAPSLSQPAPPTRQGWPWQGKWVWTEGEPSPRNSYTYFRKSFELPNDRKQGQLYITADSRYQVWVNGTFVGRGPVRSDRRWLYYDTWDIGPHLKNGRNVLGVLVHHYGEFTFQYMKGRGGLLADVQGYAGVSLARTDTTWRAIRSEAWATGQPRMSIQLGFNEIFDARKEPAGWRDTAFDDASWPRAAEIGVPGMEPWPNLVARDIPAMLEEPLEARKILDVKEVSPPAETPQGKAPQIAALMGSEQRRLVRTAQVEAPAALLDGGEKAKATWTRVKTAPGADVSFLIDFGKEVTGFPRFRVRGAKGGEILDMGYGEVLQDEKGGFVPQSEEPDLNPDPEKGTLVRLNPDRDRVHYADRYICRAGEQEFQTFDKRAFRYLQLDVRNAPAGIELDGVSLLFSTFPVKYRGAFQSSDDRLNRIWEIGRYTCQLNMEDGYTDCPWRERGQWWGDARVEALINYYCFGDTSLIRKALRQKAQSQNEEGITWGVYPTDWDGGRLPSFTLIWVSTLWDTYLYTGDREIVRALFPNVRYALDKFFAPKVGPNGLLKDVPYWVFIDWAPVDDKGESGALNAYYYDALRRAAQMARLLEDPSAGDYEKRADAVRQAVNSRLWDSGQKVYRDSILPDGKLSPKISQQTNSLCVLFDIAPKSEQQAILDFIYAPANKERVVQAGSPYFSYYLLAALYHAGRHQQALAYIREQWGRMLDWGATTWWEIWQPGASFCHGWSGGPTFNLSSEVLGVKPLKPGFSEVEISPQWVGLQYATGVVPTAKGEVQVAWQHDPKGRTAAVRIETPDGIPTQVLLPGAGDVRVNKKPRLPEGISRIDSPAGTTRFRLERGGEAVFELREK